MRYTNRRLLYLLYILYVLYSNTTASIKGKLLYKFHIYLLVTTTKITITMVVTTDADGSCGRSISAPSVCLSVCLFIRTISKNSMQLESPNLIHECTTLSSAWKLNYYFWRSKGQRSRSRVTKNAGFGVCTLVSAGFFCFTAAMIFLSHHIKQYGIMRF